MKDVFVIVFSNNELDRSILGLIGAGQELVESLSSRLRVVVVGPINRDLNAKIVGYAGEVILLTQPELNDYHPETYLSALTAVLGQLSPRTVLFANDTYSQELTPRLAFRLNGSSIGDAAKVEFVNEALRVTRQVYGGKAEASFDLRRVPAVVWVRSRSFHPARALNSAGAITEMSASVTSDVRTRLVEKQDAPQGEARLEDAMVIVSGGRGIGGAEPFVELQELAHELGAQIGASRAVCDAGWVPPTWQVGQTGKKVSPNLYLAIAISGASQHLAGISEATVIAAINTDQDAPIFKHCQFGIVEDYKKVLPILREKIAELKS